MPDDDICCQLANGGFPIRIPITFALVFFLAFQKAIVKRRNTALELR